MAPKGKTVKAPPRGTLLVHRAAYNHRGNAIVKLTPAPQLRSQSHHSSARPTTPHVNKPSVNPPVVAFPPKRTRVKGKVSSPGLSMEPECLTDN